VSAGHFGSYSVMVPASRDEAELEATLRDLVTGDDPPSEVLVVVGPGDEAARAVADRAAERHRGLVTVMAEDALFAGDRQSFSVMVPVSHDEAELEATLTGLVLGDDPPSEVLVVVGAADPEARVVAERAAARRPGLVKVVTEDAVFAGERRALPAAQALGWLRVHVPWRPLALAIVVVVVALSLQTTSFVYLLYVSISLLLGAIAWTTLVWMLHAWRTPGALSGSGLTHDDLAPAVSFSLIVPARHEETVLEGTLSRLVQSDHPDFEVLVVVGDDDPATRAVAERVAERYPGLVKVVVDDSSPKSKPRALNAALRHCSGSITGVFDAEDDVHPALLQRVDQCFQKTRADVVQAGVQLMNFQSSWLTVRNVLEYYFWFRSRLHFHAAQGFIPLGGNTVFIRTQLLQAVSGWDDDCLAEDCELGVRLSSLGAKTVVFYEPELVTREECPATLGAFTRQRTRWNQGYLQTLERGHWRRLPLRQRALGLYTLAMPYLMAVVWLTVPVAIVTAVAVKAPVPITLISFLPALPMLSMLAVEIAALGEFCRTYGARAGARDYGRLVLGLLPYQSVLAFAAARAVVRERRGDRGWEKTEHHGLHLSDSVLVEHERAESTVMGSYHGGHARRAMAVGRGGARADGGVAVLEPESGNGNGGGDWSADDLLRPLWVEPEPVPAPRRRALGAHKDLVLLVVLLAGIAVVQATNMLHWPERQFDEGTYVSNAWAIQHGTLAPYTFSYGHPPLGWLIIALWTWARGLFGSASYSIDMGRQLMLVTTLVSCSLLFVLARRLGMTRVFAAAGMLLFALSPVGLFFHRAVLLDNVAIAWVLAAFVLALSPRRGLWAFAGSGACFALSMLSKETTLVLLPALLVAAAQHSDGRTRRYSVTLLASFLTLVALSYPLYATLKGELMPGHGHVSLIGYAILQLVTRQGTGSLFDPHSETHAIVSGWLGLDPWLLGAAFVLTPIALVRRSTRAVALAFVIQLVMILRPGYLPNMYVIGLLPFAALVVSGAAEAFWKRSRLATAALAVIALVVVAPRWAHTDRTAASARLDGAHRAAQHWLLQHVGRDKRLIVSDDFWIYLVEHGFDHHPVRGGFFSRTVVVYWPLDYDPAVKRRFPNGWRDFDYVVSTEAVRSTLKQTPTTAKALGHSAVVAQFGQRNQRIEVRAIKRGQRSG
jgi:glycosyltransferase XagB